MRKEKERKTKETNIGKIIYGFLLFMPLIAIIVTCLITTFNMSAKEETEITYRYKSNEVNSIDDLVLGNIYTISINKNTDEGKRIYSNEFVFNMYDTKVVVYNNVNRLYVTLGTAIIYDNSLNIVAQIPYINDSLTLSYIVNENTISESQVDLSNSIEYMGTNPIESVETHNVNANDVFYNSVDKVTESPLFNWAQNSIIYTGIINTCTQLSITNTFIPLLMAYWLIISVIYILYDIILMMLILFHRKVHELQDSI